MRCILKNAKVFSQGVFHLADVFLSDGKIVSIGNGVSRSDDTITIDISNMVLFPGFVDVHVHLREPGFPYKETIRTGTLAAAHGGFAHVAAMPNLNPVPDCGDALNLQRALIEKDALGYVADGTLYFAGAPTPLTGLTAGKKQLVGMGAYICVFPDKKFYNTADSSDYGSMDAEFVLTGTVSLAPCRYDGSLYSTEPTSSDSAPENPENDALWLDTGSGAAPVLRQYSAALDTWAEVATPCTRVTLTSQGSVPALFAQYDGVSVAGLPLDELNGEKIIYALGGASGSAPESDYLVLSGVCPASADYEGVTVSVARRVPDMDYVCQCRNRLWGCRTAGGC